MLIAVIGATVAALLVVLAASGLSRLVVDPDPGTSGSQPEPASERWLVDHLSRIRGIRHVVGVFDRFAWGGAMVAIGLVAVLVGGALVGWLLSTVDSDRGFARFDESAAEWGADNATEASTTTLRYLGAAPADLGQVGGLGVGRQHQRLTGHGGGQQGGGEQGGRSGVQEQRRVARHSGGKGGGGGADAAGRHRLLAGEQHTVRRGGQQRRNEGVHPASRARTIFRTRNSPPNSAPISR